MRYKLLLLCIIYVLFSPYSGAFAQIRLTVLPAANQAAVNSKRSAKPIALNATYTKTHQVAKVVNDVTPLIKASGTMYALSTYYGDASITNDFKVSGTNLQAGITITPPTGFEVSIDDVNFSSTITVGSAGFTGQAAIYVRLSSQTNAGNYSGNIVLSSTGADNLNITMPKSTVSPAIITITGYYTKQYGANVTGDQVLYATTPNFNSSLPGLRNGNTLKSIKFTIGSGGQATAPVGSYSNSVQASDFQGDNGFLPGNYSISYDPGPLKVVPAPLAITANNVNKPYGTALTDGLNSTSFVSTGIQNAEAIGYVKMYYGLGGPASAPPGLYASTVTPTAAGGGTFTVTNYDVTYKPGDLAVTSTPTITYNSAPAIMRSAYGSTSTPASTQISGTMLNGDILVTAPAYFEVSLNNIVFTNTVTLKQNPPGSVQATTVYIRIADHTPAGDHNANLLVTSNNASPVSIPLIGSVGPVALTITAKPGSKAYGMALTPDPKSINFIADGLKYNETVGYVMISYNAGGDANAAPGTYSNGVIPSGASGGSFSAANYIITYKAADLVVNSPGPTLSYTGQLQPFHTVYGTPSASQSFTVSGKYLLQNLNVTAPKGFEVGQDNINFTQVFALRPDANGNIPPTTVYIRFTQFAWAGSYNASVQLLSLNATDPGVPVTGVVDPAPLTITLKPATKVYGTKVTDITTTNFTATKAQNSEGVDSVTVIYGAGGAAGDHIGVYPGSVTGIHAKGLSFNEVNYNITYIPADLTVTPAPLTITARDARRPINTQNPTFGVTYTGFVNNDGPSALTTLPTVTTTATIDSKPGLYPLMVDGAKSTDYNITYLTGTLTIYIGLQDLQIYNTFTPNGDGINDKWVINNLEYYPTCTVSIFNRYGQQLYFSHGYSQPWDGTFKSKPVPTGTYYYVIAANDGTDVKLSGYVAVIR